VIDRLERLLNLVAALLDTERPLTAEEIGERLPGYPTPGGAAFKRAFERDKATLREMGVPLDVIIIEPTNAESPIGYRVRRERYELPDPGLAPEEVAALHLAATQVRLDGTDAPTAAIWKLGGVPAGTGAVTGPAVATVGRAGAPVPGAPVAGAPVPGAPVAGKAANAGSGERQHTRSAGSPSGSTTRRRERPAAGSPEGIVPEGTLPGSTPPESTPPEGTPPEGTPSESTSPGGASARGDAPDGASALGDAPAGASIAARAATATLPGSDHLAALFSAAAERRTVTFPYRGEQRTVDPWRLEFRNGSWYLVGWDHVRAGRRTFRLDRLDRGPQAGEAGGFERPETTAPAPTHPWEMGDEEPVDVHLHVDADQADWAVASAGPDRVRGRGPDGSAVLRLRVTNRAALRSWVLGFLDHAEVLAPPAERRAFVAWLHDASTAAVVTTAPHAPPGPQRRLRSGTGGSK